MVFSTPEFERELGPVLAAGDRERALATAARIADGDADSWLREWTASGGEAWQEAKRAESAALYLHAAACYGAAFMFIADTDGSVDERALWERQRECWDRAVALLGGEHVAIPYETTTLPGYFFAAAPEPRPLVVIDGGGWLPTSHALTRGGTAAAAAGYHWMTFDGPGRQAALIRQRLVLRPDWEAVLTPVADAMVGRRDVDAARLAVIGLDHAGYGVARALAFEHRFAAAVVDPGIVDVSVPWLEALPGQVCEALLAADRERFDRELHLAGLFDHRTSELVRRRGRWYDLGALTPFDLYRRIRTFRLGAEVERIRTPLLVCERPGEPFWPGQAQALFDRLRGRRARHGDEQCWLASALH